MLPPLEFKQADEPWEFDEIFQLNYASFVEEVPQHPSNDAGVLVDRFHDENTYFICRREQNLVGMICVRDRRPFSLDEKLGSLEAYLPQAEGARVCEVRLLTVRPDMRRTRVLTGLLTMMARYCQEGGYDYVVMSGRVSQQALYRHIGFIPFGPVVGDDDAAPYQPMYRPVGNVGAEFAGLFHDEVDAPPGEPVILTPGPVAMPDAVVRAFSRPPLSHRSPEFAALMQSVRRRLRALTNAAHCAVMVGSGTLANDVVAAQLSRLDAPGVIVTAGEFGERLLDHSDRMGLRYTAVRHEWGDPLDYGRIQRTLADAADGQPAGWLWMTHCETSTGALADLSRLKAMCRQHDTRLALDCISSIGATPVDLSDVWLASGASGKALAAYPGLGLVFSGYRPQPDATLPPLPGPGAPLRRRGQRRGALHPVVQPARGPGRRAGPAVRGPAVPRGTRGPLASRSAARPGLHPGGRRVRERRRGNYHRPAASLCDQTRAGGAADGPQPGSPRLLHLLRQRLPAPAQLAPDLPHGRHPPRPAGKAAPGPGRPA